MINQETNTWCERSIKKYGLKRELNDKNNCNKHMHSTSQIWDWLNKLLSFYINGTESWDTLHKDVNQA